jgi:hypothetical protein
MKNIPAHSVLLTTYFIAILLMFGCKKDAPLTLPALNISSITNITKSSAPAMAPSLNKAPHMAMNYRCSPRMPNS